LSKVMKTIYRNVLLGLCIVLLLTTALNLAPEVGAASDADVETETEMTNTDNIPSAEDVVLTQRAITMDEAKKEAQLAVSEQLAIIAADEEAEVDEEDVDEIPTEPVEESTEPETTAETSPEPESSSTPSEGDADEEPEAPEVQATDGGGYLMDIDNPDPNYVGYSIALSDVDRDLAERIIMGEAGSTGYIGMALVAQCLRDTYIAGGYTNIADVISENGYYGSMDITPSQDCKDVVSFIFDQGGSAVQHRIRVFYASNYCTSSWHEAQQYVCSLDYVRFFDM